MPAGLGNPAYRNFVVPVNGYEILKRFDPGRLSENGYFSQSQRQAEIIILEILHCIPVVIISAFLDLEKNISFSDNLLGIHGRKPQIMGCSNVLWDFL